MAETMAMWVFVQGRCYGWWEMQFCFDEKEIWSTTLNLVVTRPCFNISTKIHPLRTNHVEKWGAIIKNLELSLLKCIS